jgi:TusA-related sulfurtransferase
VEKKSLGRGLEDITDIFISQKKATIPPDDSPSENLREAVGESCPGHVFATSAESMSFSEDDIITVIGEKLKVNRNCPNTKHSLEHDLSAKADDLQIRNMKNTPEDCPDICEITEHVTSKKKLEYLNTPDVQQKIEKSLFQYLRQNYKIKTIELVRVNEVSRPGIKNRIEENLLIYIKEKEHF